MQNSTPNLHSKIMEVVRLFWFLLLGLFVAVGTSPTSKRSKRAIVFDKSKPNKVYQKCLATGSRPGHCVHAAYCDRQLKEENPKKLLQHLCVIEGTDIGVCCPDDSGAYDNVNQGGNLIYHLPSTGDSETTVNDPNSDLFKTPENRGCGMPTIERDGRQNWPWMAEIIASWGENFCGAVLITEQHVVTAAHCFNSEWTRTDPLRIRLGEYDFATNNESRNFDAGVEQLIIHEEYDPGNMDNDIAIIKLNRTTAFNSYIWPICLPPTNEDYFNKMGTVVGWGLTSFSGIRPDILLEVDIPIWELDKCRQAMTQPLSDKVFCAGAEEGGKDSCQGDSGAPFMVKLDNGRWVNFGVVSWGVQCGVRGRAGVYTKVNQYLEWIAEKVSD